MDSKKFTTYHSQKFKHTDTKNEQTGIKVQETLNIYQQNIEYFYIIHQTAIRRGHMSVKTTYYRSLYSQFGVEKTIEKCSRLI